MPAPAPVPARPSWGAAAATTTAGSVFLAGTSDSTWGTPIRTYSAGTDLFVTKLAAGSANAAPQLAVPGAQTVNEDSPLGLSGISVSDADGNLSTTRLTVGNGTLTVSLAGERAAKRHGGRLVG